MNVRPLVVKFVLEDLSRYFHDDSWVLDDVVDDIEEFVNQCLTAQAHFRILGHENSDQNAPRQEPTSENDSIASDR
jgi:hypothetical protein